jgi:hypothetical protein
MRVEWLDRERNSLDCIPAHWHAHHYDLKAVHSRFRSQEAARSHFRRPGRWLAMLQAQGR